MPKRATPGRRRLPYSLYATAGCGSARLERLNEAAKGGRGAGTIGWPRRSATNEWVKPKGAYSRSRHLYGAHVRPQDGRIFPNGSKLPAAARRLSGRGESRPGAQESRL